MDGHANARHRAPRDRLLPHHGRVVKRPLVVRTDMQQRLGTRAWHVGPPLCLAMLMARTHRGGIVRVAVTVHHGCGPIAVWLLVQMLRRE